MDLLNTRFEHVSFGLERPFTAHIRRTSRSSRQVPVHFHRFLEMVHFLSGRGGTITIDGRSYPYRRNDLIIIRPYALHTYRLGSYDQEFLIAQLDYATFLSLFAGSRLEERVHTYLNRFHHLPPVQKNVPQELVSLLRRAGSSSGLACITGVFRIQEFMPRTETGDIPGTGTFAYARLLAYLEEHFQEPVSLDTAARICNMSRYHFSRTFKKFFAGGWARFLQKFRLERAASLLLGTDDEVGTVGYATGFSDPSYFIRIFRENYGITPAEYRKRYRT